MEVKDQVLLQCLWTCRDSEWLSSEKGICFVQVEQAIWLRQVSKQLPSCQIVRLISSGI